MFDISIKSSLTLPVFHKGLPPELCLVVPPLYLLHQPWDIRTALLDPGVCVVRHPLWTTIAPIQPIPLLRNQLAEASTPIVSPSCMIPPVEEDCGDDRMHPLRGGQEEGYA